MDPHRGESASYQLFMLALCVYTLLVLAAEALLRPEGQTRLLLDYADDRRRRCSV
jgi:hypothetical protein